MRYLYRALIGLGIIIVGFCFVSTCHADSLLTPKSGYHFGLPNIFTIVLDDACLSPGCAFTIEGQGIFGFTGNAGDTVTKTYSITNCWSAINCFQPESLHMATLNPNRTPRSYFTVRVENGAAIYLPVKKANTQRFIPWNLNGSRKRSPNFLLRLP